MSMGLAFGLNLIFPIGNLMRALFIGLNIFQFACTGDELSSAGSIYAFTGPILYLILQSAFLLLVLINLENNKLGSFWQWRKRPDLARSTPASHFPSSEVRHEQRRVEGSADDLLRALHVSKSFGALKAVDDVCFGLPKNDILALLGPNGAGKSTLVEMLSSQIVQDGGSITLCGENARSASAQRNLGG
jgi:ATP-binding cassette, subfamily A (ABC1), member 3